MLTTAPAGGAPPPEATHDVRRLFRAAAARWPASAALRRGTWEATYAELDRASDRLGAALTASGAGRGAAVVVACEQAEDVICGLLGALKAGCLFVPLDPRTPPRRRQAILAVAAPAAFVVGAGAGAELIAAAGGAPILRLAAGALAGGGGHGGGGGDAAGGGGGGGGHDGSDGGGGMDLVEIGPDDPCYLYFTSGSTGQPKAITGRFKSIAHFIRWEIAALGVEPGWRVSQLVQPSFDAFLRDVFVPLCAGGTVCIPPDRDTVADSRRCAAWLADEAIQLVHCVPSFFRTLLHGAPGPLPALRWVLTSGEPLLPADVKHWRERQGGGAARLVNLYGPSETTMTKFVYFVAPEDGDRRTIPIGKPMPGARALLLDPQGRVCPPRVVGEIHIRTAYRSLGYFGRPDLTAEVFVQNPFTSDPNDLIYRTGDLGRVLEDGNFEFLGRRDGQVKIRGVRIELAEIESLLVSHPAVRDAVVVDLANPDGTGYLCAYVVLDGPRQPMAAGEAAEGDVLAGLRAFLADSLADHSLPSIFMAIDELPRTLSGKVDRRALPTPQRLRESRDLGLDVPRSYTEEVVAGLFAEMLGLDRIGLHESFFALGGHSLLAAQVLARVRSAFEVEVPLRALFAHPTVAGLAQEVQAALRGPRGGGPPLTAAPRGGGRALPLSFAQQRLWFLDRLQPGSAAYNLPLGLRLRGELAVAAMRRSLDEVVRRHEALRTTFADTAGEPAQSIAAPAAVPLGVIDLGGLAAPRREGELARLVRQHARRPFDLAAGPLLRAALVRLGATEHAMLLNQHHIVSDGWSTGVLVRELAALYGALAAGRPPALPELAVQYADFAAWQRQWLAGDGMVRLAGYWRQRLAGLPALLDLPADRPRPAFRAGRGGVCTFHLPTAALARLRQLARGEETTLFMAVLALFQCYLARLAGQEDLAVGTVVANRDRAELEPLIGFFVNTLVMRADLSGRPRLGDLLRRSRESALAAYAHQDLPFDQLVEALQPGRATGYTPLFQVLLTLHNVPEKALSLAGLEGVWIEGSTRTGGARFDLGVELRESPLGLIGTWEYAADLFDRTTVARWSAGFARLLAAAAAAPAGARPDELPLLGDAERQQLMVEWNDTEVRRGGGPAAARVHELFEAQAARRPAAPAVSGQGVSLTYGELDARANRLARHLRRLGVGPEARVGLCVGRSPEMVVALLGILKAGGAYVPLDPDHPAERLALMLAASDLTAVVTEERWLPGLARLAGAAAALPRVVCLDRDGERIAAESAAPVAAGGGGGGGGTVDEGGDGTGDEGGDGAGDEGGDGDRGAAGQGDESLAYMIYTSGSTGLPKGVCLPHRAVVNFLHAMAERLGLDATVAMPALTTLSFDIAALEIYLPLALGGRVEVVTREEAEDGERLARRLTAAAVTAVQATPATWRLLLDAGWRGRPGLLALSGGEALPWDLAAALQALGVELWNVYGPTETAIWSTAGAVAAVRGGGAAVGLGRPLANTRLHVADRELRPVPLGVAGELLIGGAGVARGYGGRPELTAERFVPDPFAAAGGGRLYRTGDLVRHGAGGELEFLGRIDHQIKLRGFRIELGEIEAALLRHPRLSQAAVVAVGDGDSRRLVACFVGSGAPGDHPPGDGELREMLRERLPAYMVPAAFVPLAAMPLTPSGKIDRHALALPASQVQVAAGEERTQRTPVEEIVARLWAEILGVPQVGLDADFFRLGGHSLSGARVISRLRQAFAVELPMRVLFEAPTVAALAAEIERQRRPEGAAAVALPGIASFRQQRGSPPPLSLGQERFWQGRHREAGGVPATIPLLAALTGPLDVRCLRRALQELTDRHEVLRTTFRDEPGGATQVIPAELSVHLPVVDLARLAPARQEREVRRWTLHLARLPFDYERGPLFRTAVFRRSAAESVVLCMLHHVTFDGWSDAILIDEISVLYNAFRAGRPSPLPPLAVQYQDFARWQRQTLTAEALAGEVSFWRHQLRGAVPVELCRDRPRPARQSFLAGGLDLVVPEALERQAEAFAAERCVTLFMTLLAAFKAVLRQASGQDDVVVTCMFANRSQAEIENLIGYFSAGLPLRTAGGSTFGELVDQVRAVTLLAHEHPTVLYEPVLDGAGFLPPGERGGITSFRIMFQLAKLPPAPAMAPDAGGATAGAGADDVRVARLRLDTGWIGQDLTLFLTQADRLSGRFRYNRDVLDEQRVADLREDFLRILAAGVADPDRPLGELLSPAMAELNAAEPGTY